MELGAALCPITSVEVAVADGFGDMMALNVFSTFESSNGAGDFQDTAVGTGRKL